MLKTSEEGKQHFAMTAARNVPKYNNITAGESGCICIITMKYGRGIAYMSLLASALLFIQ